MSGTYAMFELCCAVCGVCGVCGVCMSCGVLFAVLFMLFFVNSKHEASKCLET